MDNDILLTRALLERLTRLGAAESWAEGLNPTQVAALTYLARANRFSRSPSHVADYLGATRGTVSQTFKSLLQKGMVREHRSESDRRSISYDLTDDGRAVIERATALDRALKALPLTERESLQRGLAGLLRGLLAAKGGRPFGICRTCRHHETREDGGYCRLLKVPLAPFEADQICHEHAA